MSGVKSGEGAQMAPSPSSAKEARFMALAAMTYADGTALGMPRPIFPLRPGDKAPATRHGHQDASNDPKQLVRWWSAEPEYGIGLPTGDGLVVVDVDVDKGGKIPSWAPATRTAATRSGGWHLYFAVDQEVPNSVSKIAPGVDVRGDGGYVVAPPTPGWRWANELPIAALDTFLLTAVRLRTGADRREPFEPAPDNGVMEGMRNDYMLSFLGWAREGGIRDADTLYEMALMENERAMAAPLDDEEVRHVWRSSMRYL